MAADPFRLSQVLRFKQRLEEQKQLELRSLDVERQRLHERLDALHAHEQSQVQSIRSLRRGGAVDPAELRQALVYLDSIEHQIGDQASLVSVVEQQVLESRGELLSILKEKRSLETLRRKQRDAAAREAARREARRVDDINSTRFTRRMKEA